MMALVLPGNQVPELRLRRLTDSELFVLCETLGHFPDAPFVYLDLSFNQISDAGARAVMILLSKTTSLAELDLHGNNIGEEGCEKLARALGHQKTLLRLNLNGNPLTDKGCIALAHCLAQSNDTLTDLDVGNTEIGVLGAIEFASALRQNRFLTRVSLDNMRAPSLQEEPVVHLADALIANSSVRELSLCKFQIRDTGAEVLAQSLERNTALAALHLRCNQIGHAGAESIAVLLERPECALQFLDLSSNRITDLGARSIARALYRNRSLRSLNLAGCALTEAGLCLLAEALRHNYTLQRLFLDGNRFGPRSAVAFRPLLKNFEEPDFVALLDIEFNSEVEAQ